LLTLRYFFSRWQNWLGLVLVALFVFIAIAAPVLSPQDPKNPGPIKLVGRISDRDPHPPSQAAPLGTLSGQVSVYHTLVWGTRSALVFGVAVAAFTAVLGVLIGTSSAYFGGFYNDLLMRITDAFLAFPVIAGVVVIQQIITIILSNVGALFLMGGMGALPAINSTGTVYLPEDLPYWVELLNRVDPVMIAFIMFSWMPYARIMNTVVLRLKQTEYVQATRALGASHSRIIIRHLIPNAVAPAMVLAARDVGGMVLLQATFTFVGLGGDSLWGRLLAMGRDWIIGPGGNILSFWWIFVPATLALVLFGVGWNLIGDGLNEALNPRTR
jgi:peptide/nickel transport system permease protein